ncbi:MAG: dipeptidase [Planctomycetota bacterium]
MTPSCWILLFFLLTPGSEEQVDQTQRARDLAHRFIIVDGHIDIPISLFSNYRDVSVSVPDLDFDYPRAVAGGLDAPFMSIFTPASYEEKGGGKKFADDSIDIVQRMARENPDKFMVATSVAGVREAKQSGKIALLLGMENGTPLEGDLKNLEHFYERGIRYITLAHSKDNHICDSSYDDRHTSKGLTEFGREVVKRMNELGIVIDVSHITDDTFFQVMELSEAPVFASHSSARAFTPGFERNMSDEMIKLLASKDGVIMITFGTTFLSGEAREVGDRQEADLRAYAKEHDLTWNDPEAVEFRKKYREEHPFPFADISVVADHIDHVVKLVGIDHVGLGSDFCGVGDTLPTGLKDVSMFPNLIRVLLERGYSEEEIEKVCSKNALRVLDAVESHARSGR